MKRIDLKKWTDVENCTGLLFFAQSMVELLFDHTLDSFKAPALNLHSSVLEVHHFLHKLADDEMPRKSIEFALHELNDKLSNDIVLDVHVRQRCRYLFNRIEKTLDSPKEAATVSEALLTEVSSVYWKSLVIAIVACVKDSQKKKDIRALAVAFSAELDQLQISKSYAYHKTLKFFFSKNVEPKEISDPDVVREYLRLFDLQMREWTIVMRGSLGFLDISEKCELLGLGIQKEFIQYPYDRDRVVRFKNKASGFDVTIVANEVMAKDVHVARYRAQEYIESIVEIMLFHNHSLKLEIANTSLVIQDDDKCFVIDEVQNPMQRGVLVRSAESEDHTLTSIMILVGLKFDKQSVSAFKKAYDFHRAALNAATPENQLIDLWAALEGLLPQPRYGDNRIEKFIKYVVPVLTLSYATKLFAATAESLRCTSKKGYEFIKKLSQGKCDWEKLAILLTSSALEAKRKELYSAIGTDPLLIFRLNYLHESFSSTRSMLRLIKSHEERVDRHLRRIYATRNHVVHNAQALPYISTLIENLHSYLDCVLLSLGSMSNKQSRLLSVSVAFEIISAIYEGYIERLKMESVQFDVDNVLDFVGSGYDPFVLKGKSIETTPQP